MAIVDRIAAESSVPSCCLTGRMICRINQRATIKRDVSRFLLFQEMTESDDGSANTRNYVASPMISILVLDWVSAKD
jgi:hypothetical protein